MAESIAELIASTNLASYNRALCHMRPNLKDSCNKMAESKARELMETRCGITQALMEFLFLGRHVPLKLAHSVNNDKIIFGFIYDDNGVEIHASFSFYDGEWYTVESCNMGLDDDPIYPNITPMAPYEGVHDGLTFVLNVPAMSVSFPTIEDVRSRLLLLNQFKN